jgi:hypothetical protein
MIALRQLQNVKPLDRIGVEAIGEHEISIHIAPVRGDTLPLRQRHL